MLLIMNPGKFASEHVVLHEPVKNQIFNDSTFTRIVYSNNVITTNGIVLNLDIKGATIDKRFSKANVQFNIYNNSDLIAVVQRIECELLSVIQNKTPVYGLYNELASGRIVVHDYDGKILIKISGIWETELNCGITYKFICEAKKLIGHNP
jgi:hypothetical protein